MYQGKQKNLSEFLGARKIIPDSIENNDDIGEVNGLAYTEAGGDLLHIEAVSMPGTGKIELTGSLGDVMKESAHAAVTYIRAHAEQLSIAPDFYKTKDIHIHGSGRSRSKGRAFCRSDYCNRTCKRAVRKKSTA